MQLVNREETAWWRAFWLRLWRREGWNGDSELVTGEWRNGHLDGTDFVERGDGGWRGVE